MTSRTILTQITPCEDIEATKILEEVDVWCARHLAANPVMPALLFYRDFPHWTVGQLNWALTILADQGQLGFTTSQIPVLGGEPKVVVANLTAPST